MNIPILIAAVLAFVAFFAHAFIGDREYRVFKPTESDPEKIKETWVQVRSGWHWVSVDLLLSSIVLLLIATTNIIKSKDAYLSLLCGYFLLCGIVWNCVELCGSVQWYCPETTINRFWYLANGYSVF